MTLRHALLLALGTASLAVLAWRLDLGLVQAALTHVGWGMAFVVAQEIVAHVCNALGWRFAFAPADARSFPLRELIRLRVAGDAVNYLTPTATLGGEVARVAMMGAAREPEAPALSVIVAKATQTLAQAVFVTAGLVRVASRWLPVVSSGLPGTITIALLGALVVYRLGARWCRAAALVWHRVLGPRVLGFVRDRPGRVALSAAMFALAYAWGAVEAYWICRFLGMPVAIRTAVAVEVLSITVDALLFVVPAKIGTQEGGKVAIFAALGLPVESGLAFGIARHVRELAWAVAGIVLCYAAVGRHGVLARRTAGAGVARETVR
jgi:glycosyltransferase 2 family protein